MGVACPRATCVLDSFKNTIKKLIVSAASAPSAAQAASQTTPCRCDRGAAHRCAERFALAQRQASLHVHTTVRWASVAHPKVAVRMQGLGLVRPSPAATDTVQARAGSIISSQKSRDDIASQHLCQLPPPIQRASRQSVVRARCKRSVRSRQGTARSYGTRQGVAGNEKNYLVEMSTCLRTHGEPLAVTQGVCTPEPTNDSSRCPPFPRRGIGRWTMILYLGRGLGSQECHCRKFNGITLRHNVCTRGARTLR